MSSGNPVLDSFLLTMPVIAKVLNDNIGIAVTDREKYLLYQPSRSLDLKISSGTPLKPGTAVSRAIEEKRRIVVRGDKNTFGLPYIAMAYPIFDTDNRVVGGAVIIESTEQQDGMKTTASKLNDMISSLASSSEEVSAQTEEIAAVTSELTNTAQILQSRARNTDQALSLIRNIAGQTNLLGLNAAIEAARVGDHGRGFGVVAEEIRKLATISADAVKSIAEISSAIQNDTDSTYQQLKQVSASVSQISEAITHVAATIQETSGVVQSIDNMADKLTQN
ncbi:chemotaxis protein [Anaerosporomusa subterranea]|uniref:Chemotaxis protein n=1 Tax=Anaerosporomusa subterranea TaxID=1794912 RepID=A0A154BSV0_ANASB|nr:methyl-accepting chemotaxis protein [Anaerosporomusa subterranea]KYZ76977.1 chemotaxis protein [Anaerosporomusa subterranea]